MMKAYDEAITSDDELIPGEVVDRLLAGENIVKSGVNTGNLVRPLWRSNPAWRKRPSHKWKAVSERAVWRHLKELQRPCGWIWMI